MCDPLEVRVVVLSYLLPTPSPPHAGGHYLYELCETLDQIGELEVLSADTTANRDAEQTCPFRHQIVWAHDRSLGARLARRVSTIIDPLARRLSPSLPYLPWLIGLLLSKDARDSVRQADVIDLQWYDAIQLLPLVRALNPRAHTLGTFHDVQSQSFQRRANQGERQRFWRRIASRTRKRERRVARLLSHAITFSEKDAALLGNPANGIVVYPPLFDGVAPTRNAPVTPPTALFLSFLARKENHEAAEWLVREIWPRVLKDVPSARLVLAGKGASRELTALAADEPSISLPGFVPSLADAYANSTVAVVPLLAGAGVKFKTVEALVHGVPTVTTPVGAEGIGDPTMFVAYTTDPAELASAITQVLQDPQHWQPHADRIQEWACTRYGRAQFRESIERTLQGSVR